ncbi:DUF523 domain-containing protein [Candidatus Woesearchaeota archaeon]|nr:DUF523 domain-containing protein [Candidatus Woesearchaeota archaeon]MBW3021773.1 DUF523 domain-containing protein [Candidatus Woesearchaeota archaeon]
MKLCSACLLGVKCRYDGASKPNEKVIELSKKEVLIPVCPEQLGGLPTPRVAQEIQGMSGEKVLDGECKVINKEGKDVTEHFVKGAEEVLRLAKLFDIKEAILKQRSPSCGCGLTFDGSFSQKFIEGDGVTTALLKRNGIKVISEEELL